MRCCTCSCSCLSFALRLKDEIQTFLRDYDRLQYIAVILIYIQIGCALIGSLGALYNGVLLINLAIALFALVAIESSSQSLGRAYALLLFCAILLDISWFILFTHQIWSLSSETYGMFFIFSIRLTLAMQIIGFSVRLSSSFLWIQIYRLGAPSREADFDLRNSFLSPTTTTTTTTLAAVPSDDAIGGSIYDPAYFSSLFEDAQENKFLLAPGGKPSTPSAFSLSLSASSSPMISSLSAPTFSFSTSSSSTSSSTTSFGGSFSSSKTTTDTKQTVTSASMSLTSLSPIVSSSPLSASLPTTSSSPIFSSSSFSASSTTAFSPSSCFALQAPKTPVSLSTPSPSVKSIPDSPKTELQLPTDKVNSNADASVTTQTPPVQLMFPVSKSRSKLEPLVSPASAVGTPSELASGSQPSFTNIASAVSNAALNAQPEHSSTANTLFSTLLPTSASITGGKNESLDIAVTLEDETEEEAPETSHATELSLGSLGSFGIGSTQNPTAPKPNPFGCPFGNAATSPTSSPFTMTVPSGQLFRPASFSFQSPQSSQPSQPAAFSAFSGGFGTGTTAQAPTQSGFGQPAQIGQGQQALGSVLGSFGQSRQLGAGLPGAGFASASGFGGGFAPTSSTGGFSSAATGGGFADVTSTGGGFAGLASAGGGFAAAASVRGGFAGLASGGFGGGFAPTSSTGGFSSAATGGGFAGVTSTGGGFAGFASAGEGFAAAASGSGGFSSVASTGRGFGGLASAGGGFAAAAPAGGGFTAAGGEFGAFSGQQGSGFGGGAGGTGKPPELFIRMRK